MSEAGRRAELLAVDVGNSSTQIGAFVAGGALLGAWRLSSAPARTADELRVMLRALGGEAAIELAGGLRGVVSSVVPALTEAYVAAIAGLGGSRAAGGARQPLVLDGRLDLGIEVHYEDPLAVGPDRLANAIAVAARYSLPAVVVDLGTAITFDVVAANGDYLGGAIAPGIRTAADGLFRHAARLPRVDLTLPARAVGTSTAGSIQSGIVLGAAILIDGMVERIASELGARPRVVATGGDAQLIGDAARTVERVDETLTLEGLRLIEGRLRRRPE